MPTPRRWPALQLVLLAVFASRAFGQNSYADPQGRFTVTAPAGWSVKSLGADAVSLQHDASSVTVMATEEGDPASTLSRLLEQYQSQWGNFQEIKRGDIPLAGLTGGYVFSSGKNPKGTAAFLKLATVGSGAAGTVALLESTPQTGYASLKPVLEQIEQSLTVATPAAATPTNRVPAPASGPRPGSAKAFLGVGTRALEPNEAQQLGLDRPRGALVGQLYPQGPAEQAGLMAWDLVTAADGAPINQPQDLVDLVARHQPGDILTLEVLRQGQTGTVKVRLGTPPSQ
jgi:hypothetical protein